MKKRIPLLKKADMIFGNSESKAKKCFIDIALMDGGIVDGCQILGLDYKKYAKRLNNAKSYRAKSMVSMNFAEKIQALLIKRFGI